MELEALGISNSKGYRGSDLIKNEHSDDGEFFKENQKTHQSEKKVKTLKAKE